MKAMIRFSILLFLVSGLQAATAQTPTRLRLKQLELAPDTAYVIYSKDDGTAIWKAFSSVLSAGGGVTGPLTSGRIPRATGTYTLSDGVLRDDGTLLALGGATVSGYSFYDYSTGGWRLATGTTAQRPTGQAGAVRFNTTGGLPEFHNGTRWGYIPPAAGVFTATRVPFSDANAQLTDDADFYYTASDGTLVVSPGRIITYQNLTTLSVFVSGANMTATGLLNVAIGTSALQSLTTGSYNVALGANALRRNNTGSYNLAMGYRAMHGLSVGSLGSYNIAFGTESLFKNTGSNNVVSGYRAGYSNTTGSNNIYIGSEVGLYSQTGANNIAIGSGAFRNTSDFAGASNNTVIGYESGYSLTTNSTGNVFLGYQAGRLATGSNQLFIENTNSTTPLIGGDFSTNTVGINTPIASIARTLHVTGEARITDLTTDTPTRIVGADADGDLGAVSEGYGINVTGGALEVDTTQIATQSDLAAISPTTLYTGDGTIATDRTVTIDDNYALITSGSPGVLSFTGTSGYVSSLSAYGYAYEIADTAFYITNATVKQPGSGSTIWYIQAGRQDATAFALAEVNGDGGVTLGSIKTAGESSIILNGQSITHTADLSHIMKIGATTIHATTSTGLGINDTSPEKSLDVGGMGKFRQISGQDNSVTIGTNANMGKGRSASVTGSQSSDVAGRFSFTTGTGLTAGEWVTLTWATAFDNPPAVQLFPEDGDGASLAGLIYVVPTTTGVSIGVNTNSASYESKTYEFNYIVIQGK